jgi:hypothetical protein
MVNGLGRGRLSGRPFHEAHQDSAFPHGDLIGLTVWRALNLPPQRGESHVRAHPTEEGEPTVPQRRQGMEPTQLRNGVPGVTMLTVVADEKKRREYLDRAKLMLRRNSR